MNQFIAQVYSNTFTKNIYFKGFKREITEKIIAIKRLFYDSTVWGIRVVAL